MELAYTVQQSGFLMAFQFMVVGSFLAPGVFDRPELYYGFVRTVASYVVSFVPMAVLIYVLYRVSQLN